MHASIYSRMEYMHSDFSQVTGVRNLTTNKKHVQKVGKFKYLESTVQQNAELDEELNHSITAGWTSWKWATGEYQ